MTSPWSEVETPSTSAPPKELAPMGIFLSSAQVGWEALGVYAFHEPREVERMPYLASPDPSLLLFAGGAQHLPGQQRHGTWQGWDAYPGEMF